MQEFALYAKYTIGIVTACLTIGLTIKFMRQVANLLVMLIFCVAVGTVWQQINSGSLSGWTEIVGTAVGAGLLAGLLSMPLLPLSDIGDEI